MFDYNRLIENGVIDVIEGIWLWRGPVLRLRLIQATLATIAESLDLSAYALKRLLNHTMTHDVTAGYIMRDVERLRKPMQRISDYLNRQMVGAVEIVEDVDLKVPITFYIILPC